MYIFIYESDFDGKIFNKILLSRSNDDYIGH